jgi:uncharacterized membrane protein YuzA (DUF378 family)
MKRKAFRISGLILIIIGITLLYNSAFGITGFSVIEDIQGTSGYFVGVVFIIAGIFQIVVTGLRERKRAEKLEEKLEKEHHWRLYKLNVLRQAEDVEKGYLKRKKQESDVTPMQERIERSVAGDRTIKEPFKEHSYAEQFYSGHASLGGRIIDVDSHVIHKGDRKGKLFTKIKRWYNRGKLEHFDELADGKYIWIVDKEGDLVIGDRSTFEHPRHGHKLPHPVLAKGERVYGAGEVLIKDGLVEAYNTASGHYFDIDNPKGFDTQGKDVFDYFREKSGWKEVKGGSKYRKELDESGDDVNF